MKYKQWNVTPRPTVNTVEELGRQGVPPLAALVLCARGFDGPGARRFLSNEGCTPHDPFLMRGMDAAVERVRQAIQRGEKMAVYGDYDVDGITATCLLTQYLRQAQADVIWYIPDRLEEGYGLNPTAVQNLAEQGVTLIVTVDCGITAEQEAQLARRLGVDLVITDHHECQGALPQAVAVVNPHQPGCPYPFQDLAGVGVALKLALALTPLEQREAVLRRWASIAAVGTVADVMRLTGENRSLVRRGLQDLTKTDRPGLQALLRESGALGKPITASTISFTLSPRLNAAGRMGCAHLAAELLLTDDPAQADRLAKQLCELNRTRQAIELEIYEDCIRRLEREGGVGRRAIVLADESWHQGVVGIVASRLSERYACPVFMICLAGGMGKGSCRCRGGINLFETLAQCSDLLEGFGGHMLAAGFTIKEEQIPALRARLDHLVSQQDAACADSALDIDVELEEPALLTQENVAALSVLEPCGAGNPRPVFLLSGVTVVSLMEVGGGRHLKMRVNKDGYAFDAIFFSATAAEAGLMVGDRADLAVALQINEFRGSRNVQLQVLDLRPAQTRVQAEQALYDCFARGETLSPRQAAALLPRREDFVALWKYLKGRGGVAEGTTTCLVRGVTRSGSRHSAARLSMAVDVLAERGLLVAERHDGNLRLTLVDTPEKTDLWASPLMQRLQELARQVPTAPTQNQREWAGTH